MSHPELPVLAPATRALRRYAAMIMSTVLSLMHAGTGCALAASSNADLPFPPVAEVKSGPAYPLKVSANNRYLVDQENVPFLMIGDAPQTLIAKMLPAEATMYMANRRRYGVNALWINLICNSVQTCNGDATTHDGIAPFTTPDDLSTPNPAYFARADEMVRIAAAAGIVVLLDPIETGGWLDVLRANGVAKAFGYGQYLGSHYAKFPNIIWLHGNDFQSWQNAADDALVQAVARGIRSTDAIHLHTAELNYLSSGTLDDPTWDKLVELDAAYTYFPTYAQVLVEYSRMNFKPVFLIEANYEFEHLAHTDGGSTQNLRRQGYWALLSGATGQIYGSHYTWRLEKGWRKRLDSRGVLELSYMQRLFAERKWYDLIPDQDHIVVTDGYSSFADVVGRVATYIGGLGHGARPLDLTKGVTGLGSISTNAFAPAARTPDGSMVIVYMPSIRAITVDMSKMAGPTFARWYDPTNGEFQEVSRTAFANSGNRRFSPPGRNSVGDGDWVLLLETRAVHGFASARPGAE